MFQGSFHSLLHAKCSACYLQRRNKPTFSQNAIFHPLLPKIYCNFLYDGDISTFKRPFHSLLHAKCRARHLRRRNKPTFSHNAIFHPILTKIYCTFLYVGAISTSKGSFHSLLHAKCSARYFQRRNKPTFSHNAIFHPILTKNANNFLPDRDISMPKRTNCCILRVERAACRNKRQEKPNKSQKTITRRY
jgi:hypothetical protein